MCRRRRGEGAGREPMSLFLNTALLRSPAEFCFHISANVDRKDKSFFVVFCCKNFNLQSAVWLNQGVDLWLWICESVALWDLVTVSSVLGLDSGCSRFTVRTVWMVWSYCPHCTVTLSGTSVKWMISCSVTRTIVLSLKRWIAPSGQADKCLLHWWVKSGLGAWHVIQGGICTASLVTSLVLLFLMYFSMADIKQPWILNMWLIRKKAEGFD